MDKRTPEQITKNMKAVKNKGSKIEVMLMKELWSRGLRYRKNVNSICGKPDIVFKGKKVAVFCDSDFKSHQEFWIPKIERNIERDKEVNAELVNEGWTVLRFWGNDIKKNLTQCADKIEQAVRGK